MEPGSDEYLEAHGITRKQYNDWSGSRTVYDAKLRKHVFGPYDYESPKEPGTLPNEVVYNDKTYTRIPESHGAICDTPACQDRFQMEDRLITGLHAFYYPILPIYTCNYEHELCALCIGLGKGEEEDKPKEEEAK